jgi:hypothetical protein
MRLKSITLTVAVLGALSVVVYLMQRPHVAQAADARIGQPIIERALLEKAAQLRLSDQGKTITLVRQADGTWHVSDYYDWPVDFTKLTRLVDDLSEAKLDRLVTTQPERIARLEFKDTRLEILDPSGAVLWSVTLGKSAESGNGRFIRFANEQKAYLTNLAVWLDPEPKNWADAALLAVKPDDIAKVEITFPQAAPVALTRAKKDDAWTADATPAGQAVSPSKVGTLLTALTGLHFTDTTELDDAKAVTARGHERTAKLTTFDGKALTISLTRKPEEKKLKEPTAVSPALMTAAAGKEGDKPVDPKLLAPQFDTIPAGPVFATISSSDANAPVNGLMKKRSVEVAEYVLSSLPKEPGELFAPVPTPAPAQSVPGSPPPPKS